MVKNLLKSILYFFIFVLVTNIIITFFNYFNLLNSNIINLLKFITPVLGIFGISYYLGKKSVKKGYLEGLKLGSIIILVFLIISLILKSFGLKNLVYYLILLLISTLGSMIGINRKKVAN